MALLSGPFGCHPTPSTFHDPDTARRLLSLERQLARESLPSLSHSPSTPREIVSRASLGADPSRVFPLRGGASFDPADDLQGFLVLLRGSSEVAVLDESLCVRARLEAPVSPVSGAWISPGYFVVGGEYDRTIYVYECHRAGPSDAGLGVRLAGRVAVSSLLGVSDLQLDAAQHSLVVVDPWSHRLHEIALDAMGFTFAPDGATLWRPEAPGRPEVPTALTVPSRTWDASHPGRLAVDGNLRAWTEGHGRTVIVAQGRDTLRIEHDGPVWSLDLWSEEGKSWLALGGVENHPLDRGAGEFGYVDSFLFLYQLTQETPLRAEAMPAFNLSEIGVVTPKRTRWSQPLDGGKAYLDVAGFGGEVWARMRISADQTGFTLESTVPVPPGVADFLGFGSPPRLVLVNSLLDSIDLLADDGQLSSHSLLEKPRDSPVRKSAGSAQEVPLLRLGEILFHSELMSPHNQAEDFRSRFSCEACHLEGGVDGRTHFTGRGHVYATTKPVRGLIHNIPLFSRAGDEAMSAMALAEFRVANQDRRDVFHLDPLDHPWMSEIGIDATVDPAALRTSLLTFLSSWQVRPQPRRLAEGPLPAAAVAGLEVFRDRCSHCHQAVRTLRDDLELTPDERSVPFEAWASWLTEPEADLLWAMPGLVRTGIEPYVAEAGARVPSLRRVSWKSPYFTNGSAATLREVLMAFRYRDLEAWHGSGGETVVPAEALPLTREEIEDLERTLEWF